MADDSIFAFAGIWDSWRSQKDITSKPSRLLPPNPTRYSSLFTTEMPVILPEDGYNLWLDPGFQRTNAVCDMLQPFDASWMRGYEVSSRVNSVKNDDACAEEVGKCSF